MNTAPRVPVTPTRSDPVLVREVSARAATSCCSVCRTLRTYSTMLRPAGVRISRGLRSKNAAPYWRSNFWMLELSDCCVM